MSVYARPPMGNATPRATMETRLEKQTAKQRKVEKDRKLAYRLVDIRDQRRCRACDAKGIIEHHHIQGRGLKGSEVTGNIVLLCKPCHDLRHVKRTLVITGNADQLLTFEHDGRVWHATTTCAGRGWCVMAGTRQAAKAGAAASQGEKINVGR